MENKKWVKLTDSYNIDENTFKNLRMKPGLSNVDIYVAGPKDELYLPDSVSPQTESCCWTLEKQKVVSRNGGAPLKKGKK